MIRINYIYLIVGLTCLGVFIGGTVYLPYPCLFLVTRFWHNYFEGVYFGYVLFYTCNIGFYGHYSHCALGVIHIYPWFLRETIFGFLPTFCQSPYCDTFPVILLKEVSLCGNNCALEYEVVLLPFPHYYST